MSKQRSPDNMTRTWSPEVKVTNISDRATAYPSSATPFYQLAELGSLSKIVPSFMSLKEVL